MKSIILHDGRKAHFPDGAKPEVISNTLTKLLTATDVKDKAEKKVADAKKTADEAQKRHQEILSRADEEKKERQKSDQMKEDAHNGRHKQTIKAMGDHVKSTMVIAQGLNGGLDALIRQMQVINQTIAQLGDKIDSIGSGTDGLKQSVEGLIKQIGKSSSQIEKVMKAPRKIISNQRGRPMGIQIGED